MAYWKIPFKDMDGVSHEVRIEKPSDQLTDSTLEGGAVPFVTQEDKSQDFFRPVRLQSGYLRISDTGKDQEGNDFDWHDFIPANATDRRVALYMGNTLEWVGYMKPETFQGNFNEYPQEREFPIQCPLSVLASFDFEVNDNAPFNFGSVLLKILGNLPNDFDRLYFPTLKSVEHYGWLFKKVSPTLFYELNDNAEREWKYNCLEMLTSFAQFYGFQTRFVGKNIWFTSTDADYATQFAYVLYSELQYIVADQPYTIYTEQWATAAALPDAFKSINNAEVILPGVKRAVVTDNVAKIDKLFEFPYDVIKKCLLKDPVSGQTPGPFELPGKLNPDGDSYGAVLSFNNGEGRVYERISDQASFTDKIFDGYKTSIPTYLVYDQSYTYAIVGLIDNDSNAYDGSTLKKKSYNWNSRLIIKHYQNYGYRPACVISTLNPIAVSGGVLVIDLKTIVEAVVDDNLKTYNGAGQLILRLKVGDKYWNKYTNTWSATYSDIDDTYMSLPIGGTEWSEGDGKLVSNRTLDGMINNQGPYPPFDGYGLPVPSGIGGIVTIELYTFTVNLWPSGLQNRNLQISSFSIDFLRGTQNEDWSERDENVHRSNENAGFTEDVDIDNIFTCDDNNAPGLGIILDPDGGYCNGVEYQASGGVYQEQPGQVLANRIKYFGRKVRTCFELEMKGSETSFAPNRKTTYYDRQFYPVSISREWADDKVKVTLIEL